MFPKLSIHNLSKSFNSLQVFENISFDVQDGEFVSFVGSSGCGKTTLFQCISGVQNQDRGEINIEGRGVKKRKGKFGYMFQDPLLLPWRNVLDQVTLGLEIKNTDKKIAEKKAKELLEKFHLLQFAYNFPHTLSGGMAQKVALLRTIIFNSDILLLDEPLGALDLLTRRNLQLWLKDVCKKTLATTLMVTHDIHEACLLSDTIYVLGKNPTTIIKKIFVNKSKPETIEKQIETVLFTS